MSMSKCGGSCGCGGMATTPVAPTFALSSGTPAPTASIAVGEPVPMTACKCGRLPWWWLLVAFGIGYAMRKRAK